MGVLLLGQNVWWQGVGIKTRVFRVCLYLCYLSICLLDYMEVVS